MKVRCLNRMFGALLSGLVLAPAGAAELFSDKFESLSLSGWRASGNATAKIVNSPVRKGNYAADLTLNCKTGETAPRSSAIRGPTATTISARRLSRSACTSPTGGTAPWPTRSSSAPSTSTSSKSGIRPPATRVSRLKHAANR